ncbi:hypothetical protein MMC30_001727 [Trapelia coarctata]|nr:hypothetical protein [Trapelia coarctata]
MPLHISTTPPTPRFIASTLIRSIHSSPLSSLKLDQASRNAVMEWFRRGYEKKLAHSYRAEGEGRELLGWVKEGGSLFLKVVGPDEETGEEVDMGWAEWSLLEFDGGEGGMGKERREGEGAEGKGREEGQGRDRGDEGEGMQLPPGMNVALMRECKKREAEERERVIGGRRYLVLNQLSTDIDHRNRGAGTLLVEYPLALADSLQIPCYAQTALEGPAMRLLKRAGFEEVRRWEIDLWKFGGQGGCWEVGMVREPNGGR